MALKYFLVGFCFCLLLNYSFAKIQVEAVKPNISIDVSNNSSGSATTTNEAAIGAINPAIASPITISPTDNSTTTTSSTTTSSTTTSTTTTSTTTTSPTTTSPTTTSPTTSTTTTSPTTLPTTTSPTTLPTTSSTSTTPATTISPSTTAAPPAPTPLPDPEEGSWVLEDKSENITCAVIHMALRMKIPYSVGVNKTEWALLNLPKNATIGGTCNNMTVGNNVTNVKLSWDNNTSYLDFTFIHDTEKKSYNVSDMLYSQAISEKAFPNSTVNGTLLFAGNTSGLLYVEAVPLGSSYKCSHKVTLNLTNAQNHTTKDFAMLTFSKIQIQAFMNSTSAGFGTVVECPGMDASDIVPIAVGCALAGLVIGVLIAFLVGRRRSHARGYLSM